MYIEDFINEIIGLEYKGVLQSLLYEVERIANMYRIVLEQPSMEVCSGDGYIWYDLGDGRLLHIDGMVYDYKGVECIATNDIFTSELNKGD